MITLLLIFAAIFGIGPVAAVFIAFGIFGEWSLIIPIAYLIACLFD